MNIEELKDSGYEFLCSIFLTDKISHNQHECSVYYNIEKDKYQIYNGNRKVASVDIGIKYLPTKGIANIVKSATKEFVRNKRIEKLLG